MTLAELPSLYPEAVERTTPPGRGQHGYFRKKNGWIVTAGAWPQIQGDWRFKGMEFLSGYGTWVMTGPGGPTEQRDAKGNPFNPAEEPWRIIFQKGGAKEFPVDQIIAYRWHLRPPYREVVFPQLEGVEVVNYFCPECDKGVFASISKQEAVDQLRIHLTCQVNDAHKYRPEDLRALGQEYGIDFFATRRGRNPVRAPQEPKAEVPEALDLTPNTDAPIPRPTRAGAKSLASEEEAG